MFSFVNIVEGIQLARLGLGCSERFFWLTLRAIVGHLGLGVVAELPVCMVCMQNIEFRCPQQTLFLFENCHGRET